MTPLGAGLGVILVAGVGALVLQGRARLADAVFRWGVVLGSVTAIWPAAALLVRAGGSPPGPGGGWYGLDPLSAWFLLIVLGVGAAAALYGIPYLAHDRGRRRVGIAHLLLAILLVALSGVVTARTIIAFLTAWEVMAVSAWLLVIFESEKAEVRRAGFIYLVLTHTSTIALFGMFAAWTGGAAGSSFADLAALAADSPSTPLILLLALIGFGIKAGMVPVHFWLPGAHSAAPSHISALLSGVMLKAGIYGLLRVLVLLGPAPAWWGWTVLLLGLASAVLGVVWALAQHDLKRLLAYHSVENIGIILMGIGLGSLGATYQHPGLALLGFTGALLHSLNHALFKSLLFLGAGVVGRVTGTLEIDRLGGLSRAIPRTATAFLIGSLAIVGLPPLNGFVSEWLVFRGLLEAGSIPELRAASAVTAGLALTGALALACFTKLHGTVFLGTARDPAVLARPGADAGLLAPQFFLAAVCITIGMLPALVMPAAARAAAVVSGGNWLRDDFGEATVTVTAISLVAVALLVLTATIWVVRRRGSRSSVRVLETWTCGYPRVTSRMQYPASGFAASLLAAFGPLSGSRIETGAGTFHVRVADPILDRVGRPVWDRVQQTASSLRVLQTGRLRWYLLYLIFSLLALLVYLWAVTR
ncbi:MAG TPA: proton-conducting transporter membrane subunit [Gemmatimonadales bacterium]